MAILWRLDSSHVQYDWLPDGWGEHQQAENGQRLVKKVDLMLRSRNFLPYTTELPSELTDEHMRVSGFITRVRSRSKDLVNINLFSNNNTVYIIYII